MTGRGGSCSGDGGRGEAGRTAERQHAAYVGFGSNLGDRVELLEQAIRMLDGHPAVQVTAVSPVYETDPVGLVEQPAFLNAVCRLLTSLSAEQLLAEALRIERALGRERLVRWGPRTIDIDVLLYDNAERRTDELVLPHPRMMERAFVLVPLLDVMEPEERHWRPGFSTVQAQAATGNGVRRWIRIDWPGESGRSES